jgi:hypothetical protein
MSFKTNMLAAFGAAAVSLSLAGTASAGWAANHPRRAEVNGRLGNQNARINRDWRDGKITGAQAAQLHAEDHAMRTEERTDARFDGGHITAGEKHALNAQENRVSAQIYNKAH